MAKLLVVETSSRREFSISRTMTKRFVEAWRAAHPGGEVVERDLAQTELSFVTAPWLQAYFTPPDQHSPDMKAALALSDELVAEVLATDNLVIATPVCNYNVPAALKAWIDHIVRKGMTLGCSRPVTSASGRSGWRGTLSATCVKPCEATGFASGRVTPGMPASGNASRRTPPPSK